MGLVVVAGIAVVAIHYWMGKNVLTDPRFYNPGETVKKKNKPKLSIKESFKHLLSSKYLACIAMLVIGYGISINIVEVTWKSQLKLQYPTPNEYAAFMGQFSYYTGFVTSIMMLFVGGNVVRMFGWGVTAAITPIVLLVTGSTFLSFIIFKENFVTFLASMGTSPLAMAVLIGMIQNIMTKSSKYSLFDPTKEMAYIPLDPEMKVKGKAAIDVVGARLGKSGGSLLLTLLLIPFGTVIAMAPYIAIILFGIVACWLTAVRSLNGQFLSLTKEKSSQNSTVSVKDKEDVVVASEESSSEDLEVRETATTKS